MVETRSGSALERWVSFGTYIVAPTTLLSALLFYFGYVSSRSQYQYFGLDVDAVGLGTQDYIMRSPQPLLVPLLGLALIGTVFVLVHSAIHARITAATVPLDASSGEHDSQWFAERSRRIERMSRISRSWITAGCVVLGAGIALLLTYSVLAEWPPYSLVTPLLIATGATLTAYASRVLRLVRQLAARSVITTDDDPATPQPRPITERPASHRQGIGVLLGVVIVASIFWATATTAQWSGRGIGKYEARHLDRLPSVILDTKERLYLRSPGIEETALPAADGQTFHYRYRRLRLLIVGKDRMFLVPDTWSASDSTLIVPIDDSVRIQFQFQNEPP